MSSLSELSELAPRAIWDGVVARVVQGELITLAVVELEPGGLVPVHQHENEQVGVVIEGSVAFTVGDREREFGPGGTWRILAQMPHEVRAGGDGAVVVEAFSPIRSDWDDLEGAAPAAPRWPR